MGRYITSKNSIAATQSDLKIEMLLRVDTSDKCVHSAPYNTSSIPVTYTWITVCVFPWYSIFSVVCPTDFWSPLKCDSVDHISYTPHRPNALTAYFLMRGRTQSVCSVKSTICHSSPISCAVHSHTVLLTQNKDGLVSLMVKKRRTSSRSYSSHDTVNCKVYTRRNVTFGIFEMCVGGEEWISHEMKHRAWW